MDFITLFKKMQHVRKVLCIVLLLFSYVGATCSRAANTRVSQCAMPLYEDLVLSESTIQGESALNGALLRNVASAREICRKYVAFESCVQPLLPQCEQNRVMKSLKNNLGYLCKEGHDAFIANYDCLKRIFSDVRILTCSSLPTRYQGEVNNLYTELEERLKAHCKIIRYSTACLASNATTLCGASAGDVIFNMMKHSTEMTYNGEVIHCTVTAREMSGVNINIHEINDVDTSPPRNTDISNGGNNENNNPDVTVQKRPVPTCAHSDRSATIYKMTVLLECGKPLFQFVEQNWLVDNQAATTLTRKKIRNLCSAYADFKRCSASAVSECQLIEEYLIGLGAIEEICDTDHADVEEFNKCSVTSRPMTTRCIQPVLSINQNAKSMGYENVSNLCRYYAAAVDCLVDASQIFIDKCSNGAAKFGTHIFTAFMATMNITTQVSYNLIGRGVCPVRLPTWHMDSQTGQLTPSKPEDQSTRGGTSGAISFYAFNLLPILMTVVVLRIFLRNICNH